MVDLLIERVRQAYGAPPVDVLVRDGNIAQVQPTGLIDAPGTSREDGSGALVLPGMVDAHCHIDKSLWGRGWVPHSAGPSLEERISNGESARAGLGLPRRAGVRALLKQMTATGTTLVRTHTDVDTDIGLRGLELVAEVAEELADVIDVEQVAFPQGGLLTRPGTAELLESALQKGLVSCLGGIDPAALERDSVRHLDLIFGLAEAYDTRLDIHLHERGTLGAHTMELIIERVLRHGLQGRVAVSHGVAIVDVDDKQSERISQGLTEAKISLLTATVYNTPVLPIAELRERGVNVGAGNDGVRDLWGPYGNGDMLDRTFHLAYRSGFRTDEQIGAAFDVAVSGGAIALGREPARIEPGSPADLFLIDAAGIGEAVAARPPRRLVLKRGKVVARHGSTCS
ncbi:cytosine deaminase [Paenarthrobacter nitroguajacolicus]|uniref:amidohydrolase n=1 Tax=Paenarthrobacter nitroguajacolicus TaxID=211146 RepID=UPI0015BA2079|nr:amidohydrolase [Paenarthrobacter nitroguajacolicus]NWL10532.1 cytosine deaminase [Paenarthrobacter nitroguajacolicus]